MARKVDDLGRIVLPSELRRLHEISAGDELDISVDGDAIVLRKRTTGCVFCGATTDLASFREKPVCAGCRTEVGSGVGAVAGGEPDGDGIDVALGDAEVSGNRGDGGLAVDPVAEQVD